MHTWRVRASDLTHEQREAAIEEILSMTPPQNRRSDEPSDEHVGFPGTDYQRFLWAEMREMRRSQDRMEKEMGGKIDKLYAHMSNLKVDIAVQKTRVTMIAAASGFVAAVLAQVGIAWGKK